MAALTQTRASGRAQHGPPGPQQKQAPSRWPARWPCQGRAAAGRRPWRSAGREHRCQSRRGRGPRPRVTWKGREANPQIPAAGFAREAGPGVREARCAAGREGGLGPPTPCPRGGFLLYHVWGRVQCFTNRVNNQSREVRGLQSHQAPHVTDRGSARDGRGAHSLKGHLPVAVPLVAVEPALVHLPVLVHQTPVS